MPGGNHMGPSRETTLLNKIRPYLRVLTTTAQGTWIFHDNGKTKVSLSCTNKDLLSDLAPTLWSQYLQMGVCRNSKSTLSSRSLQRVSLQTQRKDRMQKGKSDKHLPVTTSHLLVYYSNGHLSSRAKHFLRKTHFLPKYI